jgi:hypothetical protein
MSNVPGWKSSQGGTLETQQKSLNWCKFIGNAEGRNVNHVAWRLFNATITQVEAKEDDEHTGQKK